jgi:MFS transporter, FHS family, glucose/mannose:H+ symporter
MGQLMSSINLIVGRSSAESRSGALSHLSAVWCIGAILSPLFTSLAFTAFPFPYRLALLGTLFLLPAWIQGVLQMSASALPESAPPHVQLVRGAVPFTLFFFLYGGVEASITGWLPLYAIRSGSEGFLTAQWVVSLLWIGLAGGRLLTGGIVSRMAELRLLRIAIVCGAISFVSLIFFHAGGFFLARCVITGVFLGPVFPLTLSLMIGRSLSTRTIGIALASCALGSAALPSLLGFLSSLSRSLQAAMLLPLIGLVILLSISGLLRSLVPAPQP